MKRAGSRAGGKVEARGRRALVQRLAAIATYAAPVIGGVIAGPGVASADTTEGVKQPVAKPKLPPKESASASGSASASASSSSSAASAPGAASESGPGAPKSAESAKLLDKAQSSPGKGSASLKKGVASESASASVSGPSSAAPARSRFWRA